MSLHGNKGLPAESGRLVRRHLLIGWAGLLVFLALGIALETLHGFKIGYYLDTRNVTRRLMWTLAHTHGTLFSLVHLAFALTLPHCTRVAARFLRTASRTLTAALLLMPAGFFLGGVRLYAGDPGPGIFLVPAGAVCLLIGVASLFLGLWRGAPDGP